MSFTEWMLLVCLFFFLKIFYKAVYIMVMQRMGVFQGFCIISM
jgi:hypothetical protein